MNIKRQLEYLLIRNCKLFEVSKITDQRQKAPVLV